MICEYGCGQEAKYSPRKGMKRWCCAKSYQSCPGIARNPDRCSKISKNRSGISNPPESLIRMVETRRKKGSFINTEEQKRKISESLKKWWKEIGWSKETRNKVSQRMKGNKYGLGKTWKLSGKTKRKMSEAKKGENHPNWNGGSSKFPYAPDWGSKIKEKIFERDSYKCQSCRKEESLVPHHIDYDKMNCDSTNLITLCNSCNMRSNYDKEKWKLLYEEKIRQRRLEKLYNMKMIMGVYRNKEHDSDWWPIFFRKRFLPRVEEGLIPKNSVCLDFSCQNYPDEYCIPEGHEFVSFDFYKHFDGTLPYEDNTFDAIIAHGSINKSSEIKPKSLHPKNIELVMTKRVRKRIAEGKMTKGDYEKRLFSSLSEKAYSICGGSHVLGTPWWFKEKVVQRWREIYRIGKNNCVIFLTCKRHGRFHRWAERILIDEDRQGKTVHIVNF